MIEDKEGDAEKQEVVGVQLNDANAAPPFGLVDARCYKLHFNQGSFAL